MTEPGPGFKPVEVDVYSMRSFALALRAEVETNLSDAVVNVNSQLKNPNVHPSGLYVEGQPFGADPRNEPAQLISNYHTGAMQQGTQLMIAFMQGMTALSNIAMKVAAEYRSTDDLNRATEEEIREKLNIPKDLPLAPRRAMMPD
ncbi:hypothetical protein [Phytomonospora endophytica]|uniref:Uncharacterized protein n=1 Tax=Phytomonospora endophytica TaxID=714109 RepID=A0A841FGZ9_9ACTN|nr:hypothetical protein [Phytomonospora endophytica]MBB6032832.1 hypothetical protein [Phytomonospora endophytica]GIG65058.1 hypothetical protein Pen01_13530 [Phytomonospora endophytica]